MRAPSGRRISSASLTFPYVMLNNERASVSSRSGLIFPELFAAASYNERPFILPPLLLINRFPIINHFTAMLVQEHCIRSYLNGRHNKSQLVITQRGIGSSVSLQRGELFSSNIRNLSALSSAPAFSFGTEPHSNNILIIFHPSKNKPPKKQISKGDWTLFLRFITAAKGFYLLDGPHSIITFLAFPRPLLLPSAAGDSCLGRDSGAGGKTSPGEHLDATWR